MDSNFAVYSAFNGVLDLAHFAYILVLHSNDAKVYIYCMDVTAEATGETTVAPKLSDALTLFQPGRADSDQHHRGCSKNFLVVTYLCRVELFHPKFFGSMIFYLNLYVH